MSRLRPYVLLYRPVLGLLVAYVVVVVVGAVLEGLLLMSVVPLLGSGDSPVENVFESLLDVAGVELTDGSLLGLVCVLVIALAIARFFSALLSGLMVRRQSVRLQIDLFRAYLGVRWDVSVGYSQGELQLLLNTHTSRAADLVGKLVMLFEAAVFVVALTVASLAVSARDTILAVVLVAITGGLVAVIGGRVQGYATRSLDEAKRQAGALTQFARGATVLRAFGVDGIALARVERQAARREALSFKSQRAAAVAVALPDLLFVLALIGVVAVALQDGRRVEEVTAVIALLYRISQYLKRISTLTDIRERIPDLIDVHRAQTYFDENQVHDRGRLDGSAPRGSLAIRDATFRYPESERPALSNVSLDVASGEFVGIVGPSGGGKSTLVGLVLGLLQPDEGTIRVGSDTTEGVAVVPQTPFILEGTIRENIDWFRDLPDDAIERAARRSGLGPVLARLDRGIDADVAQEGLSLSGGERQRLALARALAGSPSILVLDEATSALDSESERFIQESLERLRSSMTIVAVAHRLSTVLSCDRIVVLEGGTVAEMGAPVSLLATPGSRFAQLAALQGIDRVEADG